MGNFVIDFDRGQHQWVDMDEEYIRQMVTGRTSSGMRFVFAKWNSRNSDVECASEEEIDSRIKNSIIFLHIEVFYFDANDFDNPVKSKLITNMEIYFPSTTTSVVREIFLNHNEYVLNDDYMDIFGDGNKGEFIGEGKTITTTTTSIFDGRAVGVFRIFYENKTIRHERKVVNILEVLGNIGGVYQILVAFISYIFEFISRKLMIVEVKSLLNSSHQSSNDDNKRKVRHYSQVECQEDSKDDEQIENLDTPFFERYVEKFNLGDVYWTAILDKSANESNSKTKSEKKFK